MQGLELKQALQQSMAIENLSIDELGKQITEAEDTHVCVSMIVDMRYQELCEALKAQDESRRKLMALRSLAARMIG